MKRKIFINVLLIVLLIATCSYGELCSFKDTDLLEVEKLIEVDKENAVNQLSQFNCAIYTQSFSKRFSLPELSNYMPENTGVLAMQFRFEKGIANSPVSKLNFAKLLVYIDNRILKIKFPNDLEESHSGIANPHAHFFANPREQRMKWSKEDRIHFGRSTRGAMSSMLSNDAYKNGKKGKMVSCVIDEHMRNIVAGIDYVKIDTGFRLIPEPEVGKYAILWFENADGEDYRKPNTKISLKDFYKIEIPECFYNKIYKLCQLMEKTI